MRYALVHVKGDRHRVRWFLSEKRARLRLTDFIYGQSYDALELVKLTLRGWTRLEHLEIAKPKTPELEPEFVQGVLVIRWALQTQNGLLYPLHADDEILLADDYGEMRATRIVFRGGANLPGILGSGQFTTREGEPLHRGQRAAIAVR